MIRVVIIDDHVVVRAGLRYIIEADSMLEFVGEYGHVMKESEIATTSAADHAL